MGTGGILSHNTEIDKTNLLNLKAMFHAFFMRKRAEV